MSAPSRHTSYGPVPAEVMAKAVAAPAGQAAKIMRQYDPLFGKGEGEPVRWKCKLSRTVRQSATVYVEAPTEEQAEELAAEFEDDSAVWDDDDTDDFEIESIEPEKPKLTPREEALLLPETGAA